MFGARRSVRIARTQVYWPLAKGNWRHKIKCDVPNTDKLSWHVIRSADGANNRTLGPRWENVITKISIVGVHGRVIVIVVGRNNFTQAWIITTQFLWILYSKSLIACKRRRPNGKQKQILYFIISVAQLHLLLKRKLYFRESRILFFFFLHFAVPCGARTRRHYMFLRVFVVSSMWFYNGYNCIVIDRALVRVHCKARARFNIVGSADGHCCCHRRRGARMEIQQIYRAREKCKRDDIWCFRDIGGLLLFISSDCVFATTPSSYEMPCIQAFDAPISVNNVDLNTEDRTQNALKRLISSLRPAGKRWR